MQLQRRRPLSLVRLVSLAHACSGCLQGALLFSSTATC